QEMQPLGETEWVEGLTAQSASGHQGKTRIAAGIIGFAELTLGSAVAPVLEAQIAASKNRLRGIRYASTWDPHPEIQLTTARLRPKGLLLDAKFQEGFACLRKYGLVFDAFVYHPQLMDLVALARAFADTNIVLNHIGTVLAIGPYKGEDVFGEWKKSMTILATCPNVYVKLGGLGMHHFGFGWSEQARPPGSVQLAKEMKPYILTCIDLFGADRCMFESNFPPDKLSYSYNIMWNAFKRITRDYSPSERAALFHDTATRVYHIPPLEAAV
ncbi:MAG: amidohydrolase family protein, partial [Chloroflexi bacterium]|nr:amidohydrolase family protein [Chloroflexota bacterium]